MGKRGAPGPWRAAGRVTRPPVSGQSARAVAIEALVAVDEGARANVALPGLLDRGNLDQRDRGFATEVVYGTVRMRRACDWLVGLFARGELEPAVRAAARAGAYQLAFMRVPPHAAVSATVAEAPERARGLVNAVLRRIAELVAQGPPPWPDLPTQLSYPDWVVKQLSADLGPERALGALKQMNQAASPQQRWDGYVQDAGSQAVAAHFAAALAGCGPGTGRVLDLCAAPGGRPLPLPTAPASWSQSTSSRRVPGSLRPTLPPWGLATSRSQWRTRLGHRLGRRASSACSWTPPAVGWGCSGEGLMPAGGCALRTSSVSPASSAGSLLRRRPWWRPEACLPTACAP